MTAAAHQQAQAQINHQAGREVEEQTWVYGKRPVLRPLWQAWGEQQKVERIARQHRCQSA